MGAENQIYEIFYPHTCLVGSQLDGCHFAKHYIAGSTRYYKGKLIFAEIDYDFRDPYFDIDAALSELKPHEDGRPKATKFIASYRILEHMSFDAIETLFLTTPEGDCLELASASYKPPGKKGKFRIYAEIDPLRMLVLSTYDFLEFGEFITDPANPIGAPKFLYTQFDLDVDGFLAEFEKNPFMATPIPGLHPSILRDAVEELQTVDYKHNKGLSLDCRLDRVPYKLIKNGFMFASQDEKKFFPMPSLSEIEAENYRFWRSMA
jgi:hypothetical protein